MAPVLHLRPLLLFHSTMTTSNFPFTSSLTTTGGTYPRGRPGDIVPLEIGSKNKQTVRAQQCHPVTAAAFKKAYAFQHLRHLLEPTLGDVHTATDLTSAFQKHVPVSSMTSQTVSKSVSSAFHLSILQVDHLDFTGFQSSTGKTIVAIGDPPSSRPPDVHYLQVRVEIDPHTLDKSLPLPHFTSVFILKLPQSVQPPSVPCTLHPTTPTLSSYPLM